MSNYPYFYYREILCYNLDTNSWFQPEIEEPKPQGRYGQTQIALDDDHLLIIGNNKFLEMYFKSI